MLGVPPSAAYCSLAEFYREFDEAWYRLEKRFFKVERLQTYQEPGDPSYEAFEQGNWERSLLLAKQKSQEADPLAEFAVSHGVEMVRVHVLETPISDYLWWEFHTYMGSARNGERILIADAADLHHVAESSRLRDFVLFDQRLCFVHDYTVDGLLRGAWKTADPGFLQVCASVAAALIAHSELFQEFCDRERPGWLDLWDTDGGQSLG